MALDTEHTFTLTIGGADRWAYVPRASVTFVDAQGGQVDTLQFDLLDADDAITVADWAAVVWTADGATKLFGGYVVRATPALAKGGDGRQWSVRCESYCTRLGRTNKVRQTYINSTAATIIADLFGVQTTLTDFDAATHVAAGSTIAEFRVDGEQLSKTLDRLALIQTVLQGADWAWRIDPDKALWFGPVTDDTASFSIASADVADYTASFPPLQDPTKEVDSSDIRNRVTVRGGSTPSADTTETFSGDGAAVRFGVTHAPIRDILRVTVGGVLQSHGTDWYDTFGGGYDCLINYRAGVLRWPDVSPPAIGTNNISVTYRYDTPVTAVVTSAASFAAYGLYFDYEIEDPTITSQQLAEDVANAVLDAYAYGVTGGTFEVARLGLRAGQRVQIEYATLGLTGFYIIQQATTTLDPGGDGVICNVRFGGRIDRLSAAVGGGGTGGGNAGGGSGGTGGYVNDPQPQLDGEVGILRLNQWLLAIARNTDFVSMSNYGTATGLVLGYDVANAAGKLLGINAGALQAYFDSDGKIKWAGGYGIMDANGICIRAASTVSGDRAYAMEETNGSDIAWYTAYSSFTFGGDEPGLASHAVLRARGIDGVTAGAHARTQLEAHSTTGYAHVLLKPYNNAGSLEVDFRVSSAGAASSDFGGLVLGNIGDAAVDTDAMNRQSCDARYAGITTGTIDGGTW